MSKEEIMELEDIESPKFLVRKVTEKKKKIIRKTAHNQPS